MPPTRSWWSNRYGVIWSPTNKCELSYQPTMGWGDPDESYSGEGNDGADLEVELDPTLDEFFGLVGDSRRRALLYVLSESETTAHSVQSLAEMVSGLMPEDTEFEDIDIELRHKHLPKLDSFGIVDYDTRSEVVVYSSDDRCETLLEWAKEREVRGR